MKEFMYIFRNTLQEEEAFARLSPKDMEQDMKLWNDWMGKLAAEGKIVGGQPLFPHGKVVRPGNSITDGPFVEGKDAVGGYLIIRANDVDEAVRLSDGCPMLRTPTGSVEVREIMAM